MLFLSHAEIMRWSPQTRLIPQNVWSYYFSHTGISEAELELMRTEVSELGAHLERMASQNFNEVERLKAWLLIAVSHPNLADDVLIRFFNTLRLDTASQLQLTAVFGRISLLEDLFKANQDNLRTLVASSRYVGFRLAALGGHLDVMKWLIDKLTELAPDDVHAMLAANDYDAFRLAACGGHLDVLNWLIEKQTALAPDKVHTMIAADDYDAFCRAARGGHLDVLKSLIEHQASFAPGDVKAMIKSAGRLAFRYAAFTDHLDVLKWLIDKLTDIAPNALRAMIVAENYDFFTKVAKLGHLDVLNWLIDKMTELAPDDVQAMLAADNYDAFTGAVRNKHHKVANRLLQISSVFAYAEQFHLSYSKHYIYPFIHEHMHALREARTVFEADNPHAVFDLDPEPALHCFYLLRHLIRRNDVTLLDEIRFLIDIPSVKALLHTEVRPNEANELLRLALCEGNEEAAAILRTVPAVYESCVAHGCYQQTTSLRSNFFSGSKSDSLDGAPEPPGLEQPTSDPAMK